MSKPHQPKSNSTKKAPQQIEEKLQAGIQYAQAGKLVEAEACLNQVVEWNPTQANAWNLLGVIAAQKKQFAIAEERIARSIDLNPNVAFFHSNLGNVLREQGKVIEAIAACRQALQLDPNFADAHHNLGIAFFAQGEPTEAIASYQKAIQLNPNHLGALKNLGNALQAQNKLAEAAIAYKQAAQLSPNLPDIYLNLGMISRKQGNFTGAIDYYQMALKLNPEFAEAHNNLGNVFREQGDLPAAISAFQKALIYKPNFAEAHNGLGVVFNSQGNFTESIPSYQMALEFNPEFAEAHWNLSLGLLTTGQYSQGWEEYEWRFKRITNPSKAAIATPMWQGPLPHNNNVLLWSEQGLGDSIQFIRYALLLHQQNISITIATNPHLVRLFKECLPTANFEVLDQNRADLSSYEVHTSLMSLPRMFQTTLENMPATVPYIQPSGAMPENLRLERDGSFQVGIVWASDPKNFALYQQKSVPLELFIGPFADLLRSSKVSFWSLQVGNDAKQLEKWLELPGVNDLSPLLKDFVDTAWVISQLDLVITVDTAVAHLAGAMGKPVWVLLPFVPDWRWLLDRQDSPWYPTMRLFRQPSLGDWQTVLGQVQEKLQHVLLGESLVFPVNLGTSLSASLDQVQSSSIEPNANLTNNPSEVDHQSIPMTRILVMSLKRRRDRYENFQSWNDQKAIGYELFEAIDGQQLHLPNLVRDNLASPHLQYYTIGALGCALSHRALWQLCVAEKRAIVICEDDAVLRQDFASIVPRLLQQLPEDWDILLLGYNFDSAISVEISPGVMMNSSFSQPHLTNKDLVAFQASASNSVALPLHTAFGSCAYAVSPKGAQEMLNRCFPLVNRSYHIPCLKRTITSFGIDSVANEFYKDIKAFCVVPPVALSPNDKRNSDISKI